MADLKIQRNFELPADVAAALHDHCFETGDDPAAVVADAVLLFLDAAVGDFDADADAREEMAEVTAEILEPLPAETILRLVP